MRSTPPARHPAQNEHIIILANSESKVLAINDTLAALTLSSDGPSPVSQAGSLRIGNPSAALAARMTRAGTALD